jgi:predicted porin
LRLRSCLSRIFYENTTAYLTYGFQKNDAKESDESYIENNIVVGLSYAFDLWGRPRGG